MKTRKEHLDWCKERALEYVDADDLINAVNSMTSDLSKHPETNGTWELMLLGMYDANRGDKEAVRRWINGFN